MKKLKLLTAYGDRYIIHENGDIERTDMDHKPSGQWKLLGIQHVKSSRYIPLSDLWAINLNAFGWLYKNGHPQWTVRDLDHGTTRVWGNTVFHGIKSIWEVK